MSEHFTKATTEAPHWCNRCWRVTKHRVSDGRLAHCLEHDAPGLTKAQQRRREAKTKSERQPGLFDERA